METVISGVLENKLDGTDLAYSSNLTVATERKRINAKLY